jgi:hypothetical protein
MKKSIIYIACLFFFFYVLSCGSNDEPTPQTQAPDLDCKNISASYGTDVGPIISTNCATSIACHASGSNNGPGPLLTYTQVFNNRNAIKTAVKNGTMPKDHALSSDQKSKIVCWIENGAIDN